MCANQPTTRRLRRAETPLPVHRLDTAEVDPQTWDRATDLYRRGDYAVAALTFGLIARVGPERQRALVAQASALMQLGCFHSAIDLLQRAVLNDPCDAIASMNLATAQLRAGFLLEALAQACASVELFRTAGLSVARPRHLQGLIYLETGGTDRARRAFSDALEAEPTFVPALLALAQSYATRHNFTEAERYLNRAQRILEHAPEDRYVLPAEAVRRVARLLSGRASPRGPGWLDRIGRLFRPRSSKGSAALDHPANGSGKECVGETRPAGHD